MERKIATAFSYIAHPLLIPILGLVVISNSGTYAADLDLRFRQFIYLSVFVFTLLLPAALIPLFYYFGLARNLHFSERRERLIPLYLTIVFYIAAYFLIKKLPVSAVYQRFIFASCISLLFLLAISYFWKLSAHMVGWGGLTGLILIISLRFNTDLMLFLILSILLSGIVGFSRLKLNEHTPLQVLSGFLLGFGVMIAVFLLK
jgi:membrane-associated phospholipid phosphatase